MFCLYPHQTAYVVPASAVTVVPDDVPAARAVLAGTVETAVNACWDAPPLIGDRIAVVGAGMVGCCVARLLAGLPGDEVTLVDVDASRAELAGALGVDFAAAGRGAAGRDLVFHTSATSAGLRAPGPARAGGDGDRAVLVRRRAGAAAARRRFHSGPARHPGQPGRRGRPSPARPPQTRDRLALALALLRDEAFDAC